MQKIQRIYCTHCTYKTSLIERTSSQSGNAVVGYSVRSSSIDGTKTDEIRKVFRAVERLLSYDLPQDTASERKAQLSASSAPRKMVFQSKLGENQAVGVISYRTKDTAGRTGSYFADIVVNNLPRTSSESQPTWTPLTAIQCWPFAYDGSANTNWWCDSEEMTASQGPDGTPLPSPASDLTKLRGTTTAFLNDQLLYAFLTEQTISNSVDKGRVISPRWSNIPVEQRQELFIRVVQAVIDIATSNKPRVVLAVEPSVASLIYYGVFRLLPEKLDSLSPGFSFTTYESRPERTPFTLTATTFDQVENIQTDLNSQLYSEGFCCNTFRKEGGFKYSKAYGDSFKAGAYTEKLRQLIQSQDQVNYYKFIDSLLECLNPLPNIASQDLDEAVRLFQELKTHLLEGVPLPPSSRLLNRSLSEREKILVKNCTCFFLTSHDLKHSPSVKFCVNLINWSGILSAESRTPEGIREKIFNFVPKTSASLSSLLESISPLRLPEYVVFKIVVPITAHNKQIPSGFVRWVKETSKQPDQGKYAEKLLSLLDASTRSFVSQNTLDKFPELLFSVLERESFYGGPNAAKNKSILVECLCAHLKKDNPWQLLLAFPRLTTVIQQVEIGGLNAIVKTLSEALTRAENLQSPPQYLDIQSQRDNRRPLQNLQNWVKLTDNNQSERLIHRYEKLIRKFDEIAAIENQSFFYKMLPPRVSKRQLQDVAEIIENLNSSGRPSKTDRPYLHLIEKQFRAAGKDIKAFQRTESAIEKYKNRVPAKLALTRKKARRNLSFTVVSLVAAGFVLLSLGLWLTQTFLNTQNETVQKPPVAAKATVAKPEKPTNRPQQSEGTKPSLKNTGNPFAANPNNMASVGAKQTRPPDKAKKSDKPLTNSNSALKGSKPTNPTQMALQAGLFTCTEINIKTQFSGNDIVATIAPNGSKEQTQANFVFLLVAANGKKENGTASLNTENKIKFKSPSSGGNFSIKYCLKNKPTKSELITRIFIPPLPNNIEIEHNPTEKIVRFGPKFSAATREDYHQELKFIPPLEIVVVKKTGKTILRKPLDNLRAHNAQLTVGDNQYTPEEVTNLKFYCVPKSEEIYRPDLALPISFKSFTIDSIIEQNKVSLKLKGVAALEPVKLLTVPFNAEISLGLLTPKVLFGGGKDLSVEVEKDQKSILKGCKDGEKLDWYFEITKERWQKHVFFVPQNSIELSDAFGLLSSKLVVQCKSGSNAPKTKCLQLFEPSVKTGDPSFDGTSRQVPESFYEPWYSSTKDFFFANLIASIDIVPNNRSVICRAIPTPESGTQRQLSTIFLGIANQELAQRNLQLRRIDSKIELSPLSWSDDQSEKFEDFFHQPEWPDWNNKGSITSTIGFGFVSKPPNEKKPPQFWYHYLKKNLKTLDRKPTDPNTYLADIKNQLRYYLNNHIKDPDKIEAEIEANQDIKDLEQLMASFKARDDLNKKLKEGYKLENFTLFWVVRLPTDSKPWLKDYYNKHPDERRVYWSRFKGQEKDAGGEK